MKRITLLAIFATGLAMATFTQSCKEEKEKEIPANVVDVRDNAIGTYEGMLTTTVGGELNEPETEIIFVSKGADNKIKITSNDGTIITTGNIVASGKDFSGNIPTQEITDGTDKYSIKGRGKDNEHFAFVEANRTFVYEIELTEIDASFSFFGTKK